MKATLAAFVCGLLFGAGLVVSEMTNPSKIFDFLDITGVWDPSLMLVMAGAVPVYAILYRAALQRRGPALVPEFSVPKATVIDRRLMLGAAIFGVGWGLGGFCPGPAVVSAAFGDIRVWAFVLCMILGMASARFVTSRATGIREPD
ncbi:MAG: DUF6691 family protein [Burkholderiales bacterium]